MAMGIGWVAVGLVFVGVVWCGLFGGRVFFVGGDRGEEKGDGGVKPAAGGKIGFLRPLRASRGCLNIKTELGTTRSVGFRGQMGQFVGGDWWGAPWINSGAGGLTAAHIGEATGSARIGKIGLFVWGRIIFF